jgi:YidC/Oxa1 family membrane protein insertase
MDEKRTLIAFLAIGAILLLLPYYYEFVGLAPGPTPVPEVEEEDRGLDRRSRALDAEEESRSDPAEAVEVARLVPAENSGSVADTVAPLGVGDFEASEVVVETPLQVLTFSTRGGVLTSCVMQEFERVDGARVEMVPAGGRGLVVRLVSGAGVVDLGEVEFAADRARVFVEGGQEGLLRMRAVLGGGMVVEKVLRFSGDRYGFEMELGYAGLGSDSELLVGWEGGVAVTEGLAQMDLREARVMALFNDSVNKVQVDGDDEAEVWEEKGVVRWAGARSKYFLAALAPEASGDRTEVRLVGEGRGEGVLPRLDFEVGQLAEGDGTWNILAYAGPLDYNNLTRYGVELEKAIDFGYPVVREISKVLLIVFKAMHGYIPNYGWIIVIFAVVIKIIVYPLTHKTYESTARMQELQPKIAALREKFGKDQQRLSKETMRLYKEEGVNPLGGCLPMVLQMPIFFALYNLFGRTIELRQAPFILWIGDLSVPDAIAVSGLEVHVLPVLMGAFMLVQQKMTMKDPKQAMLVYLMPVMMIFIFWGMSSGLVLYWTIFNVLTIAQQVLVGKLKKRSAVAGA